MALVSSDQAVLEVPMYVLGLVRSTPDDVYKDGSSEIKDCSSGERGALKFL